MLLEADQLRVRFGHGASALMAVDGVSLSIEAGASLGIVGESGSGKSTVARAIAQVVPTLSGRVILDGREVTNARGGTLRYVRNRVQMVFQDPFASLNPRLSIGVTLKEAVRLREQRETKAASHDAEVRNLLDVVSLSSDFMERYPHELSGGQLQRVCIARALARKPTLLILDEVTSALDVSVQASILNLLRTLRQELGLTFICISHDLSVISYLCERVMVLYLGQSAESAMWSELLRSPRHPYTRVLLDSVPQVRGDTIRPFAGGEIPDPRRPPPGCRFHTRCPIGPLAHPERTRCFNEDPHAAAANRNGRVFACHFPLGVASGSASRA